MSATKKMGYKIPFWSFVSMIFLTVYGIGNPQQIYYQMGYASITYLVIAALIYFIPYCFIVAEMSSAFKDKSGGIFSWMSESVSEKFGLIGTLIWYGSFVINWFTASTICISISVLIFGRDTTSYWHFLGLNSPEILAIVGSIYMIIAGIVSTRGIKRMTALSNIAIATVIIVHILILGSAILIFFLTGGHFAQGFHMTGASSLFYGPNKNYASILPALGFLVFVIFSYGGMENIGGMVDKVQNAKKNVPKAIIVSCIAITALYILIVILTGVACNWTKTFGSPNINLANFSIAITQQQFFKLGTLLGFSAHTSLLLGEYVNRLLTLLTLIGLAVIPLKIYTPIKAMFSDLPKGLIPEKLTKENKHGVPSNAIIFQTVLVVVFLLFLGFAGKTASTLYNKIILMNFVAGTVPYVFIVFAYIKFKANDNIKKDYQFFSKRFGIFIGLVCFIVLAFTNVYSIIEPALQGNINKAIWIGGGPVIFGILGFILYRRYEIKNKIN